MRYTFTISLLRTEHGPPLHCWAEHIHPARIRCSSQEDVLLGLFLSSIPRFVAYRGAVAVAVAVAAAKCILPHLNRLALRRGGQD